MSGTEIEIEQILKHFRDLVGAQAQEIAMLKALNSALQLKVDETLGENTSKDA